MFAPSCSGCVVNARDVAGYTAVHQATSSTSNALSLSVFRLIADRFGADVNALNRFGESACQFACMNMPPRPEILEAMLAHGAKVGGHTLTLH